MIRWIVASCRPYLARTVTVAVVVGTVLFAINQLDIVLEGRATSVTWLKIALTYLVPFLVSDASTRCPPGKPTSCWRAAVSRGSDNNSVTARSTHPVGLAGVGVADGDLVSAGAGGRTLSGLGGSNGVAPPEGRQR